MATVSYTHLFVLYKPNFTGTQIVDQIQDEISKLQNAPLEAKDLDLSLIHI